MELEFAESYADALLLAAGRPTAQCEEWAVTGSHVEDEVVENNVMRGALKICRAAGDNALYARFRRLLIEKPVLTPHQFLLETAIMPALRDVLQSAYQPASATYAHNGLTTACQRCDALLIEDAQSELCCEDSLCRREGATRIGRQWSEPVLQLRRGLRRFVARPGRAELKLFQKLTKRRFRNRSVLSHPHRTISRRARGQRAALRLAGRLERNRVVDG